MTHSALRCLCLGGGEAPRSATLLLRVVEDCLGGRQVFWTLPEGRVGLANKREVLRPIWLRSYDVSEAAQMGRVRGFAAGRGLGDFVGSSTERCHKLYDPIKFSAI